MLDVTTSYENYPSLGSGTEYYEELEEYVDESGFKFDLDSQPTVEEFFDYINEPLVKVGSCRLCVRDNVPLKYNKDGSVSKVQKAVIESPDCETVLVVYEEEHEDWDDGEYDWLYTLVYGGRLVKVGMTGTTLKKRYESYSCGARKAMKKGSCSSTNFVISETNYTALLLGHDVEIYGLKVPRETKIENRFGITREVSLKKVQDVEEMLTDVFIEYTGHMPVLCVQKGSSTSEEEFTF